MKRLSGKDDVEKTFFPLIRPLDAFVATNVILFMYLCVFTYYARYISYRGGAHVWEFFVYAAVILLAIMVGWFVFRRHAFGVPLLVLVQAGILAHFAGAYIQIDGHRLYDSVFLGIRYDKYVHFSNAFVVALVLRHIFMLRMHYIDALVRFFILLGVLGLGAMIEIMEYLVCKTIPGNGVGGYDNNMQDLISNFVGGSVCVAGLMPLMDLYAKRSEISKFNQMEPLVSNTSNPARRGLALAELSVLLIGFLVGSWWVMPLINSPMRAFLAILVMIISFVYVFHISPVHLHGDSPEERGLGRWRSLFIRTDNLRSSMRGYGVLTLAGAVVILLMAVFWNPGVFAKFEWKSFGSRFISYSCSAFFQELLVVGFVLVRLKQIMAREKFITCEAENNFPRNQVLVSCVAAMIFSAIHFPNFPIMMLVFAIGFPMSMISYRTPNVFVAWGCHFILGLMAFCLLELPLRGGIFHDHPKLYFFRTLVHYSRIWIGGLDWQLP